MQEQKGRTQCNAIMNCCLVLVHSPFIDAETERKQWRHRRQVETVVTRYCDRQTRTYAAYPIANTLHAERCLSNKYLQTNAFGNSGNFTVCQCIQWKSNQRSFCRENLMISRLSFKKSLNRWQLPLLSYKP